MRISDWSSDVCSSDLFGRDVTACLRGDRDRQVAFFVSGVGEDRAGPAGVVLPQLFDLGVEREVDRKRVVKGKRVSVRVDLGGRRIIKIQKTNQRKKYKHRNNHIT